MQTSANVNANSGIQIGNATIPAEGPKAIPYALDFSAVQAYGIDVLNLFQNRLLSVIQCVYVDNSNSGSQLILTMTGTQQTIKVPAGAQGYFPVLSPTSGQINAVSLGGVVVKLDLLNVPMSAGVWYPGQNASGSSSLYDSSGNLKTVDQGLAPFIDPVNGLKVQSSGGSSSGGGVPVSLLYRAEISSATSGTIVTGTGNYMYLTRIECNFSSDALGTAGHTGIFRVMTGLGVDMFRTRFDLPTAAPAVLQYPFQRGILYESANPIKTPVTGGNMNFTVTDETQVSSYFAAGKALISVYGYTSTT
jgi:hypothetical protein